MEELLSGDYIAGFVDGEGCFALKFRRDVRHERKNKPVYFSWDIEFVIVLRADDVEILEMIKRSIGCGRISINKNNSVRYSVQNTSELVEKVAPFFKKYPLHAKKRLDFELWTEALQIFAKNQRKGINSELGKSGFQKNSWDENDLKRLINIHQEMKRYKASLSSEWKWLSGST